MYDSLGAQNQYYRGTPCIKFAYIQLHFSGAAHDTKEDTEKIGPKKAGGKTAGGKTAGGKNAGGKNADPETVGPNAGGSKGALPKNQKKEKTISAKVDPPATPGNISTNEITHS